MKSFTVEDKQSLALMRVKQIVFDYGIAFRMYSFIYRLVLIGIQTFFFQ